MNRVTPIDDGIFFDNGFRKALRSPTYSICYVKRKYLFRRTEPYSEPQAMLCDTLCIPVQETGLSSLNGILHRRKVTEAPTDVIMPDHSGEKAKRRAENRKRIGIRNISFAIIYSIFAICILYTCINHISSDSDIGFSRIVTPNSSEYETSGKAFSFYSPTTYINLECESLGINSLVAAPAATAREFVKSLDLGFDDDDILSCADDVIVTDGMTISVDIVESETVEINAEVPFSTQTTHVQTIPKGTVNIIKEGRNGSSVQIVKQTYINGELSESEIISETVTTEPVTQICEEGVGGTVTIGGKAYSYSYYRDVEATAYGGPEFENGRTSSGKVVDEGMIAVDPDIIALGSSVYIMGENGYSMFDGFYKAEDTGGLIVGDRIDVYTGGDINVAINFGRRAMRVYIFE